MFKRKNIDKESRDQVIHHPETKHANGFRNVKELCQDIEYQNNRMGDRLESKINNIDNSLNHVKSKVDFYWNFFIGVIALQVAITVELFLSIVGS